MKEFLIRDITPELGKDFKAACAYYDLSMKAIFLKHMQNIVDDYIKAIKGSAKPKTYIHRNRKKE